MNIIETDSAGRPKRKAAPPLEPNVYSVGECHEFMATIDVNANSRACGASVLRINTIAMREPEGMDARDMARALCEVLNAKARAASERSPE